MTISAIYHLVLLKFLCFFTYYRKSSLSFFMGAPRLYQIFFYFISIGKFFNHRMPFCNHHCFNIFSLRILFNLYVTETQDNSIRSFPSWVANIREISYFIKCIDIPYYSFMFHNEYLIFIIHWLKSRMVIAIK